MLLCKGKDANIPKWLAEQQHQQYQLWLQL